MWDFSMLGAFRAMLRTWPFIVLRIAVYFGIALLYIVSTGAGGSVGYLITSASDDVATGAAYGAFAGFAGASGLLYWAREYVLYLVKAGHLSVLVNIYDGQPVPGGREMITEATAEVKERFTESSMLFGLDQLIKGSLRVIGGTLSTVASLLPIPYLGSLIAVVNRVIRMSLTFTDEVILAYLLREESNNSWHSARDGIVLYAQNYKHLLKNAVWLSLFTWMLSIALFVVLIAPAAMIVALTPAESAVWPTLIALLLAWSCKQALLEPIAMYALLQVYFKVTEGQVPDQSMTQKLDKLSSGFRELGTKAENMLTGSPKETLEVQS